MSTLSALGARALPASYPAATTQNDGKTTGAPATHKSGSAASSPLSLSSDALDMQKRVASLGGATVDFAEDLMNSFTQALFGDGAKGATIDFDSASLETSSSYALGVQQSSGPHGTSSSAAFSLTDSSHFLGKGTITTADGRKFDFEVEIQYDYQLDAAASQTTGATPTSDRINNRAGEKANGHDKTGDQPQTIDLPTVQLPNIDFAGTLADLFQLIGRDLHTALSTGGDNGGQNGGDVDRNTLRSLSLRLLNLVDSKDANTYTAPTQADQAKSAAAYGDQAGAADKVTGGPSGAVDPQAEGASSATAPAVATVAADDGKGAATAAS